MLKGIADNRLYQSDIGEQRQNGARRLWCPSDPVAHLCTHAARTECLHVVESLAPMGGQILRADGPDRYAVVAAAVARAVTYRTEFQAARVVRIASVERTGPVGAVGANVFEVRAGAVPRCGKKDVIAVQLARYFITPYAFLLSPLPCAIVKEFTPFIYCRCAPFVPQFMCAASSSGSRVVLPSTVPHFLSVTYLEILSMSSLFWVLQYFKFFIVYSLFGAVSPQAK